MVVERNEYELIKAVRDGDKTAMEEIFNTYVKSSVKLAYLITRQWTLAEDAVQEAFIKAFTHIDTFNINKSFHPWFTKIVVNEARKLLKKINIYSELDLIDNIAFEEVQLPDNVIAQINGQALLEQVNKLELKYRLPIILKYYSAFSEKEIGSMLNIPLTTVKIRLYRARQKLKAELIKVEGDSYGYEG
jgi:RNA polymerase sigma-70 factor (ECF subfamily)